MNKCHPPSANFKSSIKIAKRKSAGFLYIKTYRKLSCFLRSVQLFVYKTSRNRRGGVVCRLSTQLPCNSLQCQQSLSNYTCNQAIWFTSGSYATRTLSPSYICNFVLASTALLRAARAVVGGAVSQKTVSILLSAVHLAVLVRFQNLNKV